MPKVLAILIRVIVIAVALGVATFLVDGIDLGAGTTEQRVGTLLVVAVIFGLVNVVLKPVIKRVGCPLYVLTLGLIGLIVNALLFLLVGYIAHNLGLPFTVHDFASAFWGAIVVAIVGFFLHFLIPNRYDQRQPTRRR